jgi:hypothetical protein
LPEPAVVVENSSAILLILWEEPPRRDFDFKERRIVEILGLQIVDSGPNPAQLDNNLNILRMDHFVPNALDGNGTITSWVMGVDAYTYDELNRLTQVIKTPT